MKTCVSCGREWPDEAMFCMFDGQPLAAAPATRSARRQPDAPVAAARDEDLATEPKLAARAAPEPAPVAPYTEPATDPSPQSRPVAPVVVAAAPRPPVLALVPPVAEDVAPAAPARFTPPTPKPSASPPPSAAPAAKGGWAGRLFGGKGGAPAPAAKTSVPVAKAEAPAAKADPSAAARRGRSAPPQASSEEELASDFAPSRVPRREGFSETLWFLEGDAPEACDDLAQKGAVEWDEGHYRKKGAIPDDVRRQYTLHDTLAPSESSAPVPE